MPSIIYIYIYIHPLLYRNVADMKLSALDLQVSSYSARKSPAGRRHDAGRINVHECRGTTKITTKIKHPLPETNSSQIILIFCWFVCFFLPSQIPPVPKANEASRQTLAQSGLRFPKFARGISSLRNEHLRYSFFALPRDRCTEISIYLYVYSPFFDSGFCFLSGHWTLDACYSWEDC